MATAYWNNRAILRQAAYDRANNKTVETVSRAYDRVARQLDSDIDAIMATYTRKTGLSPREAYDFLHEGVPDAVLADLRLRASIITDKAERRRLETILNTGGYRARISRIDAIKAASRTGLTEAAEVELSALKPHLERTADMAYSRMMYDTQMAAGVGFQGAGVPRKALDAILKSKWAGDTFSQSVWANRDAAYSMMSQAMSEMSSMGKLSDPTLRDLRGMVDINKWQAQAKSKFKDADEYRKYAANRLIRTESAYVAGQTTAVAYDECDIERYEFISILDSKTSQVCGGLDGQIFATKDREVGVNWPPLHPFCRSSTACVIDGVTRDGLERRGKDKDGKSVLLPRDMKYQEWQAWQKDGAPADIQGWRSANTPKAKQTEVNGKVMLSRVKGGGNQPDGSYKFDINAIIKEQGFDGLPTLVNQGEYDKLIEGDSPYMKRGYTAPTKEVLDEYKRHLRTGDFYVDCSGGSAYGKGMYTACAESGMKPAAKRFVDGIGDRYGSNYAGISQIEQITMKSNAKIGSYDQISEEYFRVLSEQKGSVYVPDESIRGRIGEALDLMVTDQRSADSLLSDIEYDWRSSMADREMAQEAKESFKDALRIYTGDGGDIGTMAARLGYDGYDANQQGTCSYRVILNRTKLIIVD